MSFEKDVTEIRYRVITEKYGDIIVPRAGAKSHYGGPGVTILGIFWYSIPEDKMDYKKYPECTQHDQFENHKKYLEAPSMVRGRFFNDNGTDVLFLYTGDMNTDLNDEAISVVAKRIEEVTGKYPTVVVDELGRDLRLNERKKI